MVRDLPGQLRSLRIEAGLSRIDLAASLGISVSALAKLETGERTPLAATVDAWAAACGRDARVAFPRAGETMDPNSATTEIAALRAQVATLQARIDAAAALLTEGS